MGFCSGTQIFDDVAKDILDSDLPDKKQYALISSLFKALYTHDWDCESDSRYYDHMIVQMVMRELNPDLDWDEIDEMNS